MPGCGRAGFGGGILRNGKISVSVGRCSRGCSTRKDLKALKMLRDPGRNRETEGCVGPALWVLLPHPQVGKAIQGCLQTRV